ncbi:MAG: 30S ribosomal protein S13 [Desulfobacteraceae bacterium]|nr:MAG: 30S ribosomal protein S13 [Desulfobacteraceae bacterium]
MSREFQYLVRIHGANLDGTKNLIYSLCDIKGVGKRLSQVIITGLGLDPSMRIGMLSEKDIKRIEEALNNPSAFGVPKWMFNRCKDQKTGEDLHLLGSDLAITQRDDIELMKETKSWKGYRHSRGLKVRGQRTQTSSRKGRSVGVSRRRIQRERKEEIR